MIKKVYLRAISCGVMKISSSEILTYTMYIHLEYLTQTDISLIKNNALVGSQIAYKLSKLIKSKKGQHRSHSATKHTEKPDVVRL